MVALCTCAHCPSYSFEELTAESMIEPEIMKKILHSLSCVKHKILIKEPKSKSVKSSDSFAFNVKFKAQQRKIRIPIASLAEHGEDKKRVHEDRGFAVDAAVVRIMKSRKVLSHNDLVRCPAAHAAHAEFLCVAAAVPESVECCLCVCMMDAAGVGDNDANFVL